MRTVPSNASLPVTRLPLPRNALVPPTSLDEPLSRSRSIISTSGGAAEVTGGGTKPSVVMPRARSIRSRSFPNSAIRFVLRGCLGPLPTAALPTCQGRSATCSTRSGRKSKRSGTCRARSAQSLDQPIELRLRVVLDFDAPSAGAPGDADSGPEVSGELLGQGADVDVACRAGR